MNKGSYWKTHEEMTFYDNCFVYDFFKINKLDSISFVLMLFFPSLKSVISKKFIKSKIVIYLSFKM